MDNVAYCKNCVMLSSCPRTTIDNRSWCNICQWIEREKNLDWNKKFSELGSNLNKYKSKNDNCDCIVVVSVGKDGSYISHQLKSKFGINPLTVTVRTPFEMEFANKELLIKKNGK